MEVPESVETKKGYLSFKTKPLRLDDPPSQSISIASTWMFGMSLIFYLSIHINRKVIHLFAPGANIPWIVNVLLGLPVFVLLTYLARRDDDYQTPTHMLQEIGFIVAIEILAHQLISRGVFKIPGSSSGGFSDLS